MIRLVIARLLGGFLVVMIVASVAFLLLKAAPGGPFDEQRAMSKEARRNIEERRTRARPLPELQHPNRGGDARVVKGDGL